jgi:hypothetical protein
LFFPFHQVSKMSRQPFFRIKRQLFCPHLTFKKNVLYISSTNQFQKLCSIFLLWAFCSFLSAPSGGLKESFLTSY